MDVLHNPRLVSALFADSTFANHFRIEVSDSGGGKGRTLASRLSDARRAGRVGPNEPGLGGGGSSVRLCGPGRVPKVTTTHGDGGSAWSAAHGAWCVRNFGLRSRRAHLVLHPGTRHVGDAQEPCAAHVAFGDVVCGGSQVHSRVITQSCLQRSWAEVLMNAGGEAECAG